MRDLHRVLDRVAQGTISVLLLGETGVGNEVIVRALHSASPRRDGPFLRINCAALSERRIPRALVPSTGSARCDLTSIDEPARGLVDSPSRLLVPPGPLVLRATADDHGPRILRLEVDAGSDTHVLFALEREAGWWTSPWIWGAAGVFVVGVSAVAISAVHNGTCVCVGHPLAPCGC